MTLELTWLTKITGIFPLTSTKILLARYPCPAWCPIVQRVIVLDRTSRWELERFESFLAALFSIAGIYNLEFEEQTNHCGSPVDDTQKHI